MWSSSSSPSSSPLLILPPPYPLPLLILYPSLSSTPPCPPPGYEHAYAGEAAGSRAWRRSWFLQFLLLAYGQQDPQNSGTQRQAKPGLWSTILQYFFGDLLLKGNHYEINVYTFFALVTSKPRNRLCYTCWRNLTSSIGKWRG